MSLRRRISSPPKESLRPTVMLVGPGQKALDIKDEAGQAAFMGAYTEAWEKTAEDIERGRAGTFDEAKQMLDGRIQTLLGRYGKFTEVLERCSPRCSGRTRLCGTGILPVSAPQSTGKMPVPQLARYRDSGFALIDAMPISDEEAAKR